MDALVERDLLNAEIARVKKEIAGLEMSVPSTVGASDQSLMAAHLLRASAMEAYALDDRESASALHWTDPLPVPYELELPERLEALVDASAEVFCGLRLDPVEKASDLQWNLKGDTAEGEVQFQVSFSVDMHPRRRIHDLRVLISNHVTREVNALVQIATTNSCIRTLVVGLAEYGALYSARNAAFTAIQQELAPGLCEVLDSDSGNDTRLKLLAPSRNKYVVIEWTCTFAASSLARHQRASEFLRPVIGIVDYNLGPTVSKEAQASFKGCLDGFPALVRVKGGILPALRALAMLMGSA